jgi:hypothetical protein
MAVALNGTRLPLLKVMAETLRYIKGEALREVSNAWHVPVTNDKVHLWLRGMRVRALTSWLRAAGALGRDGARGMARCRQELHAQGGTRGRVRARAHDSRQLRASVQASADNDAASRACVFAG